MTIFQPVSAEGCGCEGQELDGGLPGIDAALERIAAAARPLYGTETVGLDACAGRILVASVRAANAAPPFDNSGMDGYAVRVADLTGSGPWTLPVQDRVAAGDGRSPVLRSGAAIQIFTGAAVPPGADAVIMQERVRRGEGCVVISDRPDPGLNVRTRGEDMEHDAIVLHAGKRLTARDAAVAAAVGESAIAVVRRTRVALLTTGDEVCAAGSSLRPGAIWDVNTPMLSAMLRRPSVDIVSVGHCADRLEPLSARIEQVSGVADIVVTTGGVSVGQEDHQQAAIRAAGGSVIFSGVAMKPGKPVSFGRVGDAHWIGLPGNPVSAFVTWTLFGEALLDALSGSVTRPSRRTVVLGSDLVHKPGRCELRPARLVGYDGSGREVVGFESATHSARIHVLSQADGLLMIPADVDRLGAGSLAEFIPLRCSD